MPPKTPRGTDNMESRLSVVETRQENTEKILDSLTENIKKLTEVAADVAHMRATIEKAVQESATHRQDLNGLGGRVSVVETRTFNIIRILYFIGTSIGAGIAIGVGRLCWIFIDFISPTR